jgi:hypothetical protein
VFVENNGELIERLVDPRNLGQKRHDILEGVLLEALRVTREGRTDMRTVGSVTAVIQLADLQAGTGLGILEGTEEVIPGSVVQELACETGFFEVLLGEQGGAVIPRVVETVCHRGAAKSDHRPRW